MGIPRRCVPLLALAAWLGVASCAPAVPPSATSGELALTVTEKEGGPPVPCRMQLKNAAGRPINPKKVPFLQDHFVLPGTITLKLPVGSYSFEIERGLEYPVIYGHFQINQYSGDSKSVVLKRHVDMAEAGWWSGDVEVHRSPAEMPLQMAAEDLHVAQVITWWNDKLPTEIPPRPLVCLEQDRCFYLPAGGYARAGGTALVLNGHAAAFELADPEYPSLAQLLDKPRQQHAWIDLTRSYWRDLPMLVANGLVDSIQIANSQILRDRALPHEKEGYARDRRPMLDPRANMEWAQEIYFQLLNCGLRIPPTAGSGSGSVPNPVGSNRVYVQVDGPFSWEKWWAALRAGRAVVTNGPLLRPTVNGMPPGDTFHADAGQSLEFEIGLTLSLREPLSYLDIIQDGSVVHSVPFNQYAKTGRLPKVKFDRSGWFLIRAVTDLPKTYRFGLTAPYYVQIGDQPRISKASAQFFLDWLYQRAGELAIADPAKRQAVIEYHRKARDFWQNVLAKANSE